MNCSNLNAHLHSLRVTEGPACGCSHRIEDTAHFFLDCPSEIIITQIFKKLMHLHLPTGCFMKISLQSTGI